LFGERPTQLFEQYPAPTQFDTSLACTIPWYRAHPARGTGVRSREQPYLLRTLLRQPRGPASSDSGRQSHAAPDTKMGMSFLRADRLATLYLFRPLGALRRPVRGLPILMYHSISDAAECGHPYFHINTSCRVFADHLALLSRVGYRTATLDDAIRDLYGAPDAAALTTVLTFDDGYEDFYTHAFPLLARYGATAIMFVPTAYIGPSSRQFKGRRCLSWSQVRELRRAGIEFGSHTVTHPQLHAVTPRQLRDEITQSKQELEYRLGEPVHSFSYPYAFPQTDRPFVGRLGVLLEETGYRRGVSTAIGRASARNNPLFLKRLPANSQDDARFFQAKLEGAYDWLETLQYAAKVRIRANARLRPSALSPP
jgi:peptidoglycan/xylan/chitin deacetylase (PgdA/CDA1 family)